MLYQGTAANFCYAYARASAAAVERSSAYPSGMAARQLALLVPVRSARVSAAAAAALKNKRASAAAVPGGQGTNSASWRARAFAAAAAAVRARFCCCCLAARKLRIYYKKLRQAGLEPTTIASVVQDSIQLSYWRAYPRFVARDLALP